MLRRVVCAVVLVGLGGCAGGLNWMEDADPLCATAPYPAHLRVVEDPRLVARVDAWRGVIQLSNDADEPVYDAQAWLNGRYMAHIDRLGAHASASLDREDFLNEERQPIPPGEEIDRVEMRVDPATLHRARLAGN